jgi:phosphoribosylformylglycinamidine synthase
MAIAEIHVTLKPTLLDAQGATVLKALRQLGHGHVHNVRIGKHIEVEFDDALSGSALQSELELMCRQLLANPVIEDYSITVGGAPIGAPAAAATPFGISSTPVSPLAAATDVNTTAGSVSTTDVVPNPQPLRSSVATTSDAQPAQFEAARISAPQPVGGTDSSQRNGYCHREQHTGGDAASGFEYSHSARPIRAALHRLPDHERR